MSNVLPRIIAVITAIVTFISGIIGLPKPEMPTFSVFENGVSDYVIVKGARCSQTDATAAATLQKYILQACGVSFPIVTDDATAVEKEIVVGKTNREGELFSIDRASLGDDGVLIQAIGEKLIISGGEKRGVIYSVYTFLEKFVGCRWYTAADIYVPQVQAIKIPYALSYKYSPVLEFRDTDWYEGAQTEYSVANRLNGACRTIPSNMGGQISYTGGMCHTFTTTFVNPSKYFDEHPEYYSIHDGERVKSELCLTNPDVLKVVIDEVQAILNANPETTLISLTQWDDDKYCECEKCAELDAKEESHQGTNLTFVNAVANHFKDAYPNLQFDTFAYWYTRKPPKTIVPAENVIVRLCSIECCFSHPLDSLTCKENREFAKDIKKWSKISNKLYIWDYTTNYSAYNGIFPNFKVLQKNIQFFVEHNVKGIFEEGNISSQKANGEFGALRCYLLSRLMWDPYLDYDALMKEFCDFYYGGASDEIVEFIDITCKNVAKTVKWFDHGHIFVPRHMHTFEGMTSTVLKKFSDDKVEKIDNLWKTAKEKNLTQAQLLNVKYAEIQWRYWKSCNQKSEFSTELSEEIRLQNGKTLYDDMINMGLSAQFLKDYRTFYLAKNPDLLKPAFEWTDEKE